VITSYNPAHPDQVIGTFEERSAVELDDVLDAAVKASSEWSRSPSVRSGALTAWAEAIESDADALARLIALEVGKPIGESRGEVARSVAILRYYAQLSLDPQAEVYSTVDGEGEIRVERRPLGVVLAIAPWNFPLAIPVWKIAPALATGNCVVLKPSSSAIAVADRLVGLGADALPDQVLQLAVVGGKAAKQLLADARIAGVSFTGSLDIGRRVIGAVTRRGGVIQAEMGGQNAALVLEDADVEKAAASIAGAAMQFAGQKCTATSRAVVHQSVARELIDALVAAVDRMCIADPLDEAAEVGPLINRHARDDVASAVDGVLRRGGRLLAGGDAPERDGWFWRPTIVAIDDPADEFAQEEVFGPAMSAIVVGSEEEAVDVANGTRYGLTAAVYSRDLERAQAIGAQLEVGLVRINAPTTGVDYYVPFGGEKASSYGPREQGRSAGLFYTKTRTVTVRPG
jgi:aldehyde dehydrogenase (NAD+)